MEDHAFYLGQAKGGKVLAVPAFMAATTIMFASAISSAERGQTSALVLHPDARKDSCLSRNSCPNPFPFVRARASSQAFL